MDQMKWPECRLCVLNLGWAVTDLDQYVLGVLTEPAGIEGVVCSYGLEQLLFVAAVERRLADEHLVEQHSKRPPVHRAVVLLTQQDLLDTYIRVQRRFFTLPFAVAYTYK